MRRQLRGYRSMMMRSSRVLPNGESVLLTRSNVFANIYAILHATASPGTRSQRIGEQAAVCLSIKVDYN